MTGDECRGREVPLIVFHSWLDGRVKAGFKLGTNNGEHKTLKLEYDTDPDFCLTAFISFIVTFGASQCMKLDQRSRRCLVMKQAGWVHLTTLIQYSIE